MACQLGEDRPLENIESAAEIIITVINNKILTQTADRHLLAHSMSDGWVITRASVIRVRANHNRRRLWIETGRSCVRRLVVTVLVLLECLAHGEGVVGSADVHLGDGVDYLIAVAIRAGWANDGPGGEWIRVTDSESCLFEVGNWSSGDKRGRNGANCCYEESHFGGFRECGCVKWIWFVEREREKKIDD